MTPYNSSRLFCKPLQPFATPEPVKSAASTYVTLDVDPRPELETYVAKNHVVLIIQRRRYRNTP